MARGDGSGSARAARHGVWLGRGERQPSVLGYADASAGSYPGAGCGRVDLPRGVTCIPPRLAHGSLRPWAGWSGWGLGDPVPAGEFSHALPTGEFTHARPRRGEGSTRVAPGSPRLAAARPGQTDHRHPL